MADEIIVTIEKLIFGGDALAHLPDGRAVFIPFVLPGEMVLIRLIADKPRFARGLPVELIKASPGRISPKCPHFTICGGCHYQHIPYEHQVEFKLEILRDQLTRIGKLQDPPLNKIIPSPTAWNYRNNIQFHPSVDGGMCFMDFRGQKLVPIHECHLPLAGINEIWPQVHLEPDSGISRLSFRQDSQEEIMVLLEGEDETAPEFEMDLPVSAAYLNHAGETTNLAGEDALLFQIHDQILRVSPESFFQVNTTQAGAMVSYINDLISLHASKLKILELFSGVGLFSLFLAEHATKLVAIESSPSACFDFAVNLDRFDNIDLYEGTVEDVLPGLDFSPDLVLLDPPRSGLEKEARQALIALNCPEIIYISCDPATLARDLNYLIEVGYELREIQAFDLFPQTYHVESISYLVRR
jgi:23S rRNA (uracil1939-C5)-methyltransferase